MSDSPFFSIVVAAYNRGRHILPTLQSALAQTDQDFEILVIGDGCTDDTGEVVATLNSPKVSWSNLLQNCGSQSAANNAGIAAARGAWIAYLGHDDIWTPEHLSLLRGAIVSSPDADIAVSGCALWGPPDSAILCVTGIFERHADAEKNFFPPSSFAHRRSLTGRIGAWRMPEEIAVPVDCELLSRAWTSGARFVSTATVSVHKFTAAHRYLSYMHPSSEEQDALLHDMKQGVAPSSQQIVAVSKERKQFMILKLPPAQEGEKGDALRRSRRNRGLSLPPIEKLSGKRTIEPEYDRGLDWRVESVNGRNYWRATDNPRPKILIPFCGEHARIEMELLNPSRQLRSNGLDILVNGNPVRARVVKRRRAAYLSFNAQLSEHGYTILTLVFVPQTRAPAPSLSAADFERISIGTIRVRPKFRFWNLWRRPPGMIGR